MFRGYGTKAIKRGEVDMKRQLEELKRRYREDSKEPKPVRVR